MTGQEILNAAAAYVDDAIDSTQAITAINEALDWLSDTGLAYSTTSITAVDSSTWHPLPEGTTDVMQVHDAGGKPYAPYLIRGAMEISFAKPGTYSVYYRHQPDHLTAITDAPAVHPAYHGCLVTYLKSWFKLWDDDENSDGLRLLSKFERDAQRVFTMLRRRRRPQTVRVYRDASQEFGVN